MPGMQCLAVETRRSSESAGLWSGDLPTRRNTRASRAVPHRAVAGNLSSKRAELSESHRLRGTTQCGAKRGVWQ